MRFVSVVILIFVLGGCASKHMRGDEAETVDGVPMRNLTTTAAVAKDLSLDQYVLVDVYLRNLNSDWLRVKNIQVVNVEGAERPKVILGPDLKTWRKSMALDFDLRAEKAKRDDQRKLLVAQKAELDNYADDDHLYAPFSVPAQLQTRKWILFQFENKQSVRGFVFEVTWMDDRRQSFAVHFTGAKK